MIKQVVKFCLYYADGTVKEKHVTHGLFLCHE